METEKETRNTGSDEGDHGYGELHFGYQFSSPDSEFEVYERLDKKFRGEDFVFKVIGNSHYIHTEDFHEICSCRKGDIPNPEVSVKLGNGEIHETIEIEDAGWEIKTRISTRGLEEYDSDNSYSLRHCFSANAETAIEVNEDSYETYHTYPEHDLLVYTETKLEKIDSE